MPFLPCDVQTCRSPSVRWASCVLCNKHLCVAHLQPSMHPCPTNKSNPAILKAAVDHAFEEELTRLQSMFSPEALRSRISVLKRGVKFVIASDWRLCTRQQNYDIPIQFETGETWICRVQRQNAAAPPPSIRNLLIESEVATLRFLSTTRIPVQRVIDYAVYSTRNPVGVGYILMNQLPGTPLQWSTLDLLKKQKVIEGYVKVIAELSRHPFPSIGCLTPSSSGSLPTPGPLLDDRIADLDAADQLSLLGPFTSISQYRTESILRHLHLIRNNEAYWKNPLDAYLVHLQLLDDSQTFVQHEERFQPPGYFFLKPPTETSEHFLVDDQLNIVGVVDWESSVVVPKLEAFAAPFFMLNGGLYQRGDNSSSAEERLLIDVLERRGHFNLASCVREGRIEHRLGDCIGGDIESLDLFPKMLFGLRKVVYGDEAMAKDASLTWKEWRDRMIMTHEDDRTVRVLRNRKVHGGEGTSERKMGMMLGI